MLVNCGGARICGLWLYPQTILTRSSYSIQPSLPLPQPLPFSHLPPSTTSPLPSLGNPSFQPLRFSFFPLIPIPSLYATSQASPPSPSLPVPSIILTHPFPHHHHYHHHWGLMIANKIVRRDIKTLTELNINSIYKYLKAVSTQNYHPLCVTRPLPAALDVTSLPLSLSFNPPPPCHRH